MLVISGKTQSLCILLSHQRFNLAIEMLVISGAPLGSLFKFLEVSISQSRCLSFQVQTCILACSTSLSFNLAIEMLVISGRTSSSFIASFRESFNLAIEMLVISGRLLFNACQAFVVSISQSRCLSFQVNTMLLALAKSTQRFNLAIEMLVISG